MSKALKNIQILRDVLFSYNVMIIVILLTKTFIKLPL